MIFTAYHFYGLFGLFIIWGGNVRLNEGVGVYSQLIFLQKSSVIYVTGN